MHYAVSNWVYGAEPVDETVSRLGGLGYDGIELVGEPDRYDRPQLVAQCREAGLLVTSILGWCIWGIPGLGPTDFASLMRAAQEIGYEGPSSWSRCRPGSDPLLAARMPENAPP